MSTEVSVKISRVLWNPACSTSYFDFLIISTHAFQNHFEASCDLRIEFHGFCVPDPKTCSLVPKWLGWVYFKMLGILQFRILQLIVGIPYNWRPHKLELETNEFGHNAEAFKEAGSLWKHTKAFQNHSQIPYTCKIRKW